MPIYPFPNRFDWIESNRSVMSPVVPLPSLSVGLLSREWRRNGVAESERDRTLRLHVGTGAPPPAAAPRLQERHRDLRGPLTLLQDGPPPSRRRRHQAQRSGGLRHCCAIRGAPLLSPRRSAHLTSMLSSPTSSDCPRRSAPPLRAGLLPVVCSAVLGLPI